MSTNADTTWLELQRLRDLAKEMGKNTDPLELAVRELQTYKAALRETRLERDQLRAELHAPERSGALRRKRPRVGSDPRALGAASAPRAGRCPRVLTRDDASPAMHTCGPGSGAESAFAAETASLPPW
jgi:hypothetical protein